MWLKFKINHTVSCLIQGVFEYFVNIISLLALDVVVEIK